MDASRRKEKYEQEHESWWQDKDSVFQRAEAQGFVILEPVESSLDLTSRINDIVKADENNDKSIREVSDLELAKWTYKELELYRLVDFGEVRDFLEDLKRQGHKLYPIIVMIYKEEKVQ